MIPQRSDQLEYHKGRPLLFDRETYRQRSAIENCVGWMKECRRIATRFEKLALNFLAMLKLVIIQRYLRIAFSDSAWPAAPRMGRPSVWAHAGEGSRAVSGGPEPGLQPPERPPAPVGLSLLLKSGRGTVSLVYAVKS